jgi:hypothetical protein
MDLSPGNGSSTGSPVEPETGTVKGSVTGTAASEGPSEYTDQSHG